MEGLFFILFEVLTLFFLTKSRFCTYIRANRFTASPLHRFTASPLHRFTASPLHRFTACGEAFACFYIHQNLQFTMSDLKHVTKEEFAEMLGISLRTLQRRLQAFGIKLRRGLVCPGMQHSIRQKLDDYGSNND
jgi:DNA-directed RNA polymerase specialized sigma24 family protein